MVRCGVYECVECCWSHGQPVCCDGYVYQYWWFWFLWGVFFVLILTCALAFYCLKRRRRMRYVMLGTSDQPAYGSVIVGQSTSTGSRPFSSVPPQSASAASHFAYPSAPAAPPAYTSAQEKPPAYSQF